jgi:hypothetical protein
MTTDNPQPRNMKAALAQLAGSQRALTTVMGELREAREENERLREQLDSQNDDGCGWKPVAEDALRLLRELVIDHADWLDQRWIVGLGYSGRAFNAWLARVHVVLGEKKPAPAPTVGYHDVEQFYQDEEPQP